MKKTLFLILLLLSTGIIKAQEKLSKEEKERREKNVQAGNPFAKFGSKAPVATLSKGKYLEVHDLDSIVTIGTIRWHVENQKIVGRLIRDANDPDAQPVGDATGRWMSPDPLSEEFPSYSPYTFVLNNPLRLVDPDGRAPDDIIVINNSNKEIARIKLPGQDVKVKVDTNLSLSSPLIIDPIKESSNRQEVVDAVGVNIGYSGTMGGGMEAGISVMYFMNGADAGNVGVYSYVGGNVGIGGSLLGVEGIVSHFNKEKSTMKSFNALGFSGEYNGYSIQTPFGSISTSWSNTENTRDEVFPGHRYAPTWQNTGVSSSGKYEGKFSGGTLSLMKQYNLNKK